MIDPRILDLLSGNIAYILGALFLIVIIFKGIRIVPQSEKFVIERFGRLHQVLGGPSSKQPIIPPLLIWEVGETLTFRGIQKAGRRYSVGQPGVICYGLH